MRNVKLAVTHRLRNASTASFVCSLRQAAVKQISVNGVENEEISPGCGAERAAISQFPNINPVCFLGSTRASKRSEENPSDSLQPQMSLVLGFDERSHPCNWIH